MIFSLYVLTYSIVSAQVVIEQRPRLANEKSSPSATIRVDKDLVLVTVSVVDEANHPVTGLGIDNFRAFDNKVEQPLLSFGTDDEPLAVGLVFDTSGSMGKDLSRSRMAAKAFFDTANPEDEFLLVEFNDRATLTVPLTDDPRQIEDRLTFTESKGQTALLDAIHLGLLEIDKSKKHRKALLILSDGKDNHSRYTQRELVKLVRETDVLIYVMGIFSPVELLPTQDEGPSLLTWIAEQTGAGNTPATPEGFPISPNELELSCVIDTFWASRPPTWSAIADITTCR